MNLNALIRISYRFSFETVWGDTTAVSEAGIYGLAFNVFELDFGSQKMPKHKKPKGEKKSPNEKPLISIRPSDSF